MRATRFAVPEDGTTRGGRATDLVLAGFSTAMLALMWKFPGQETIPYHFLFVALTIVYGFRVWPPRPTAVVISAVTVTTGLIFFSHWRSGDIHAEEMAEVPLMPLLFLAMVWHARRRQAALVEVRRMADERAASLQRERELLRDTSHAIRTPVTIARGHTELVAAGLTDPLQVSDTEVVLHQLDRMAVLGSRLLALAELDTGQIPAGQDVDVSRLVESVARNWAASVNRHWVLDVDSSGVIVADPDWLETALDALLENAVKFTSPDDTIRVSGRRTPGGWLIEVADSGPGISPADAPHVFDRYWHRTTPGGSAGSGLGLAMVRAVATAHGGDVGVGHAPEGGARLFLRLPGQATAPVPADPVTSQVTPFRG